MASGRYSTVDRASPATTWEARAGPGESSRISRSRPRPRPTTSAWVWARAIRTHSAWTSGRDGSSIAWVAARHPRRPGNSAADSRGPGRDPSGLPRVAQRGVAPFRDRSRLPRHGASRCPAGRVRSSVRISRAKPAAAVRIGPDRRDTRRGDRSGREAEIPRLGAAQGAGEPIEGRADRPLRLEGADGDARGVRPLRRRRGDRARESRADIRRPTPASPASPRRGWTWIEGNATPWSNTCGAWPPPSRSSRPASGSRRRSRPARRHSGRSAARAATSRSWATSRESTATCSCTTWALNPGTPTPTPCSSSLPRRRPRGRGPPRGEAGTATVREWRTPPLWGLRDSGPYLHDGRAARIDQAIALHAGQGAAAARRYAELSPRRKRQVEAFLMSLAAPPSE